MLLYICDGIVVFVLGKVDFSETSWEEFNSTKNNWIIGWFVRGVFYMFSDSLYLAFERNDIGENAKR